MRPKHLLIILVLLALAVPASPVHASGVVSVCDEAHLLAALSGGGTVTFACSGTIILTNPITIAANTTVDGSGQAVTISGNNAVQVFSVNTGVTLSLKELTIANGNGKEMYTVGGGGVETWGGTVNIDHSTFTGNTAYNGGAVFCSNGTVTISHSTFTGNTAYDESAQGGAIMNWGGTLTVTDSTFCLLYTSPSPRDTQKSRMPSSA
jgi:predicted outer membrane repeat protein